MPTYSSRRSIDFRAAPHPKIKTHLVQNGDDTAIAVNSKALAGPDARGRGTAAHHRGQAVFAGYDGGVGHGATDIADRRFDFPKNRAPTGSGDRTHQDFSFADLGDVIHIF